MTLIEGVESGDFFLLGTIIEYSIYNGEVALIDGLGSGDLNQH